MEVIKIIMFFNHCTDSVRLHNPNHVGIIVWESTGLPLGEIKSPTISLALEVIHFYNGKSATKFNNFSTKKHFLRL